MKKNLSDFENVKILLKTISSINKFYIPAFILTDLIRAIETVVNIYIPMIFINSLQEAWPKEKILKVIIGLVALKLFLRTVGNLALRWKSVQVEALNIKFPQVLAQKTMDLSYENLEDPKILDLKERALYPITSYGAVYTFINNTSAIVKGIFTLVASFSIIFAFSKALLALSIGITSLTILIDKKMSQKKQSFQEDLIPINRKYGYYISLMGTPDYQKEIRLFQMNGLLLDRATGFIGHIFDGLEQMYIEMANVFSLTMVLQSLLRFVSYSYIGLRALTDKFGPQIELGQFALLISANENFVSSFKSVVSSYLEMKIDIGYLRPFSEFMALEEKDTDDGDQAIEGFESLTFERVTFAYPNTDRKILDDISFTIRKGEKISIVGLNNAGKTTIIKLVCRFFEPDSGRILINGKDISSYDKASYYKLISAVFQDFALFPMTIGDNIVADMAYDENRLKNICQSLGIDDFIEDLKYSYSTLLYKDIYEGAVDLSGGQKQKIAIARALYRGGDLVILDEPTAALDPLAEAEIYENFDSLTDNKTAIYISHRMSSSKFCDKILLLEDGDIKAFGPHKKLFKENKFYRELYQAQAKYFL